MASKLGSSLQNALREFLVPLEVAALDEARLRDLLGVLGLTQAVSSNPTVKQLIGDAGALSSKVAAFDAAKLDSLQGVQDLLEIGSEAQTLLRQLQSVQDPALTGIVSRLAEELLALLLASYLRRLHPTWFRVGSLLTLIDSRETGAIEPALEQNGETLRYARVRDQFKFSVIEGLLSHPGQTLKDAYLPNGMATGLDARLGAQQLFPQLAFLAELLGLSWRIETQSVSAAPSPLPLSDESLELDHFGSEDVSEDAVVRPPVPVPNEFFDKYYSTFTFVLRPPDLNGGAGVSINVLASSLRHPGATAGYILALTGMLNSSDALGSWRLTFSAQGQVPAFVLGPTGFSIAAGSVPVAEGAARVLVESVPLANSTGPAFILGGANSSRVEFGTFRFATDLFYGPDRSAIEVTADASSAALVIAPGDGDGFLSSILPAEGLQAKFDLGLAWSSERGLTLRGSAGLAATLPIGLSIGGITLSTVHLSLQARDASVLAEVSVSIAVSIGPVWAVIEQVGIATAVTFPEDGGNLGVADLDFRFKPPNGLGLTIDAPVILGGGYLGFDPQKEEYSGMLELQIAETIAVKAIGLLTTRMPDGGKGYSLVVIIFVEGFAPIQLGFGFALTGIGGLLGINRTFNEETLRSGLKNHTLDSVMFPQDPIRNAPQIISNLNKVFPPANGHHLFGPMAQIAWGTPPLITANLGVVLEFGARLRLLILAQVVAILPKRENDLVRLQMDAIGVIDFDQGTAALDATLYDSRLLKKFVLTGDIAMRLKWEDSPHFALAVGGLHPAFNPPPAFPKLERIALNLSAGDNPRLRCEAYFALTSNTLQFGARAELYASASGFSIQGETGFDVLIQLDPFYFVADFYAQLQLKRGTTNLFKVRVEGALAGPRPLHIKAKATFEILWMDVSFRFDKTLVEGEKPPPPEPVDVLPQLKEALSNPGNWISKLPDGQRPMVTLRAKPGAATDMLLHPLGTLTVKQSVVPLNMDISRFGQAAPAGARRFTISSVSLGGQDQTTHSVTDFFAPAQFFEMSDDEKLARPSFEPLAAGVSIGSDEFFFTDNTDDWLEVQAIKFETITVDKEKNKSRRSGPEDLYKLSPKLLGKQARFGAAGTSDLRRTGKAKYRTTTGKYQVAKEGWSIVVTDDLSVLPALGIEAGKLASYSEAAQALRKMKQEDPTKAAGLKILRLSEVRAIQ